MFELKTHWIQASLTGKKLKKKRKSALMFLDDHQATLETDKLFSLEGYW